MKINTGRLKKGYVKEEASNSPYACIHYMARYFIVKPLVCCINAYMS